MERKTSAASRWGTGLGYRGLGRRRRLSRSARSVTRFPSNAPGRGPQYSIDGTPGRTSSSPSPSSDLRRDAAPSERVTGLLPVVERRAVVEPDAQTFGVTPPLLRVRLFGAGVRYCGGNQGQEVGIGFEQLGPAEAALHRRRRSQRVHARVRERNATCPMRAPRPTSPRTVPRSGRSRSRVVCCRRARQLNSSRAHRCTLRVTR